MPDQSAGDLDELPLTERQPLDKRLGIDRQADRIETRPRFLPREKRLGLPPAPRSAQIEGGEVLADGEVGEEAELLVDRNDARGDRLLHRAEGDDPAIEPDRALVGPDRADDDLDQRALAGAVLAEDGVDPARVAGGGPRRRGRRSRRSA